MTDESWAVKPWNIKQTTQSYTDNWEWLHFCHLFNQRICLTMRQTVAKINLSYCLLFTFAQSFNPSLFALDITFKRAIQMTMESN